MVSFNNNSSNSNIIKTESNSPLQRRLQSQSKLTTGSNSTTVKRKLIIRPLHNVPQISEQYEQNTMKKLYSSVEYILSHTVHSTSKLQLYNLEELYRSVESLCKYKKSVELYAQLYTQLELHITHLFNTMNELIEQVSGAEYLTLVESNWILFSQQITIIRSIYLYLDRTYIINNVALDEQYNSINDIHIKSIWDLALLFWCYHIHTVHHNIQQHIVSQILQHIENDRNHEIVPKYQLKLLCNMFKQIKLYKSFESQLIESTRAYYTYRSQLYINELNITDYIQYIQSTLQAEQQHIIDYLDSSSTNILLTTVKQCVIQQHSNILLQNGLHELFVNSQQKLDELQLLYTYFIQINQFTLFQQQFHTECQLLIESDMKQYITSPSDTTKSKPTGNIIQNIIDNKILIESMVARCFDSSDELKQSLRSVIELLINQPPYRISELLAKYVTLLNKRSAVHNIELIYQHVIYIYRLLSSKDMFVEFYRTELSKRLLIKSVAYNETNELLFISLLKQESGINYIQKLYNMFHDITNNITINQQFNAWLSSQPQPNHTQSTIDYTTQILTTGNWPNYSLYTINYNNTDISALYQLFTEFYQNQYSGRKLNYVHSLSTVTIKAQFNEKPKEIICSLVQYCILNLFQYRSQWSYTEIVDQLQCSDITELRWNLYCLSVNPTSHKILIKSPGNKSLQPNDTYQYNYAYTNESYRLILNKEQGKEKKSDQSATEKKVNDDRQYTIDACIVRIMKTKKICTHNQLITDIMSIIKFPIQINDIKKRIGSLIEREYMERDKDNPSTYIYQA